MMLYNKAGSTGANELFAAGRHQRLNNSSTHPHPGIFSVAEYSPAPLLALISSFGCPSHLCSAPQQLQTPLLSSAPAHLLGQSQWPTSLRCIYPCLAPRLDGICWAQGPNMAWGFLPPLNLRPPSLLCSKLPSPLCLPPQTEGRGGR